MRAMFEALLDQHELASKERLGVALRSATLHAADPRQPAKGLFIEPLLGTLAAEMRHQEVDLALKGRRGNGHVEVRLPDIAVPFGDFIFKNAMIAKRIPGQAADLAVVLMRIVAPVR